MSQIDDGGPAFPVPDVHHPSGQIQFGSNGMSLRDWFAGQALAGMMADGKSTGRFADTASDAYDFADEMLAQRRLTERK